MLLEFLFSLYIFLFFIIFESTVDSLSTEQDMKVVYLNGLFQGVAILDLIWGYMLQEGFLDEEAVLT